MLSPRVTGAGKHLDNSLNHTPQPLKRGRGCGTTCKNCCVSPVGGRGNGLRGAVYGFRAVGK
nr:MAG TPA: hypothetical protein [Caudoviricetes sp.]